MSLDGGYLPGQECSTCKGRCCREHGCCLSPEDFARFLGLEGVELINPDIVLKYLISDNAMLAIDSTGAGGNVFFYIRMRTKCYTFISVEPMGECIALTVSGCSFDDLSRPKGGRYLKPSPDFRCVQEYSLENMISDWMPYQTMLSDIWNKYYDIFEKDGTFDKCDAEYYKYLKSLRVK